jgi:uncharacterized protein (DUF697 family)
MHDLDRIQMETEFENPSFETSEFENELEGAELEQELEQAFAETEMENEQFLGDLAGSLFGGELESPLNESEELELASELLGIGSEMEFEQFLGNLFSSAAKGIGNFAKSSAGRALGGVLKNVAKKAIPVAGRVLGGMVGGPIGSSLGGQLGDAASNLFELEFEGMNAEDREFEAAKKFVRFGATAAKNAAHATHAGTPPRPAVKRAVTTAARAHAPGLLRPAQCTDGRCAHRHVPHAPHPIPGAGHPRHVGHPMHARIPGQHGVHPMHGPHPGHRHHPGHMHGQHPHAHHPHAHHPHAQHLNGQYPQHPAAQRAFRGVHPQAAGAAGMRPGLRTTSGQGLGFAGYPGRGGYPAYAGYPEYADGDYPSADYGLGRTGRWVRRGRHIVLLGMAS